MRSFGFKPKYDEDTGEILEYYKEYLPQEEKSYYRETIKFYIKNEKRWFKTHRSCCGGTWNIFDKKHGYEIMDLLYDLIKADMVVKE